MLTQIVIAVGMLAVCWLLVTAFQSESVPALQRTSAAEARMAPSPRQNVQSDAAAAGAVWEHEGGAFRERS
jgi:hypothetical protein